MRDMDHCKRGKKLAILAVVQLFFLEGYIYNLYINIMYKLVISGDLIAIRLLCLTIWLEIGTNSN